MSKSEAIRQYKQEHPEAGPTEIAQALAAQGVQVSPAMVSVVLSKQARKNATRKSRARATVDPDGRPNGVHYIIAAKRFAEEVGGVDYAMHLLATLKKLLG